MRPSNLDEAFARVITTDDRLGLDVDIDICGESTFVSCRTAELDKTKIEA
jgi:hypothetical protein